MNIMRVSHRLLPSMPSATLLATLLTAATLLAEAPAMASETLLPDGISGAVWTSTPTVIDRKQQSYERLPAPVDPYGLKFRIGQRLIVFDSGSFALNGRIHLLDGVRGLPPRKICRDERGHRLACGASATAHLRRMLHGKLVECRRKAILPIADILDCRIAGESLSKALIDVGAALPANDRTWPETAASSAR